MLKKFSMFLHLSGNTNYAEFLLLKMNPVTELVVFTTVIVHIYNTTLYIQY